MKIAELAIQKKTVTLVLTFTIVVAGLLSFDGLSRLEDPEYTIKDAVIKTAYPGATALEVEEEVTDKIEVAIQKLGQLKELKSESHRGLSIVTAKMKDKYDKNKLPQVWDELRRKVNDVQRDLPPGAGPSLVNDDYGDVFGVFLAVYGEEYSYAELYDYAKFLRKELLLVRDVAKIELFAVRREVVYVELDRDRMSQLGISPNSIIRELRTKNLVANAGRVEVGTDFLAIQPTGLIRSVEDFESLLISGRGSDRQIYLRDIATVKRGYVDPPVGMLRFDGQPAVGLGVSTVAGGNVVNMGEALQKRGRELMAQTPLGLGFGIIALQSDSVAQSIDGFLTSLYQAVAIVVVVLLFFMGLRSGLLIGFILLVTICGTFILMDFYAVALERISLGALIIALGMLVDNAIVVVDGMLVKMQQGVERVKAASEVVSQTAWPLLGATVVAVVAFAAIGTSQDNTGEYCRSLFQVILFSLMLSWVTAITVTPLLGVMYLKAPVSGDGVQDPYGGRFYGLYRRVLSSCIRKRWATITVTLALFATSVWGFGFVEQSFFPNSTRPQFMVDYWMPQGTHINDTAREVAELEEYLMQLDGVTHVASVIGAGALRFMLVYAPEKENSAYAQLLVEVDDYTKIDAMMAEIHRYIEEHYPHSIPNLRKFQLGPGEPGKIQARFNGADPNVLRSLANQAEMIIREDGASQGVRIYWGEREKVVQPILAEEQANLQGITTQDVANVIKYGFEGVQVGVYREKDELLPITLRAPGVERRDIASMQSLQIWSPAAQRFIPLRQVVSGFETVFEDGIIERLNRKRSIRVLADPKTDQATVILARIKPKIEAIELPVGYELEWWGEYRDSKNAQDGLKRGIPVFLLLMILVVIVLYNSIRQTLVIWLVVPLAVIGVAAGLLLTKQPFGFMALLGFMSLSGMLIKNAIVLVDQMNVETATGKDPFDAIIDSGVSRLRPVGMAAATTVLGMAPLFPDAFFVSMAVTIAFGLSFATLLTMIIVPVLYAIFYRVKAKPA